MVIEEFTDRHRRTWKVTKSISCLFVVKPTGLTSIDHPDYRIFKTYNEVQAFIASML